ncbi:MAG: hypothetical protein GHCLOJNM_04530 [bacterium]|nr:hypothetical protein [bacterium]
MPFRNHLAILLLLLACGQGRTGEIPKTLAYYAQPNPYFNAHAEDVAKIHDGFFFVIGSWDEGVASFLGVGDQPPQKPEWRDQARENLSNLRKAGATESLLAVSFSDSAEWPSAPTLLSEDHRLKFEKHFASIGKSAKELGFAGVSIDVEYPYPRYDLTHSIYNYEGYIAEDLLAAAARQGKTAMAALLDQFPEAVIFLLPGDLWGRPIERAFYFAMLEEMAERDAPGGLHLGYERAYCLLDPVAQVAIPRVGDFVADRLLSGKMLEYWKRRCTVAPGVWPVHMVETGGKDYPKRPWPEELAELREQMRILRSVAKRYIWSFSGQPLWFEWSPEIEKEFGLSKPSYPGIEEVAPGWHSILRDRTVTADPASLKLIEAVREYDHGKLARGELCDRFGTPGEWLVLGPLGNPYLNPAFSAPNAPLGDIRPDLPLHGRDGVVRWFKFEGTEPTGSVRMNALFEWRATDKASAHLVTWVEADEEQAGVLNVGWDDGIVVRIGEQTVFDRAKYPERGHGLLFRDRYDFEEQAPVVIPKGKTRVSVTSINSHGSWGFNLRFTDEKGHPLEGLRFTASP